MTRRPLFAANWKCFKTPDETRAYVDAFKNDAEELIPRTDIALLPPFIDLDAMRAALDGTTIAYGAQDCFWEPQGAFTGEVSAAMLGALGCEYCLVGHSERRRLFGDTDEIVAKKVSALLAEGITPIVCIGETLEEYKKGLTLQRCMEQASGSLGHLEDSERANLVVAYEPVWAIGTGLADDPESANRTIGSVRHCLGGLDEARILYGGSMKADNAAQFCAQPNIDGGLIGSASLDPADFLKLVRSGAEVRG